MPGFVSTALTPDRLIVCGLVVHAASWRASVAGRSDAPQVAANSRCHGLRQIVKVGLLGRTPADACAGHTACWQAGSVLFCLSRSPAGLSRRSGRNGQRATGNGRIHRKGDVPNETPLASTFWRFPRAISFNPHAVMLTRLAPELQYCEVPARTPQAAALR